MCSAPSPDRYPRPHRQRAFVYHRSPGGPLREPGPRKKVPRKWARAGERAFRRRSPRLISPSHHSRPRFLNLVPNGPAPRFWTLGAKTVNAAGIGALRVLSGGTTGRVPSVYWWVSCREVDLPRQFFPAPLKVIWRTRESARSPLVQLRPERSIWRRALPSRGTRELSPADPLSFGSCRGFCLSLFWGPRRTGKLSLFNSCRPVYPDGGKKAIRRISSCLFCKQGLNS